VRGTPRMHIARNETESESEMSKKAAYHQAYRNWRKKTVSNNSGRYTAQSGIGVVGGARQRKRNIEIDESGVK
jgi:hypothetical protein